MSRWGDRVVPYPQDTVARYRAAGAWGTKTISTEFRTRAERFADHTAVVTAAGELSYRELDERSDQAAAALLGAGLQPGDAVILQLINVQETAVAWYGVLKAGLVPVCSLAAHRTRELEAFASVTGARGHLVSIDYTSADLGELAAGIGASRPDPYHILTVGSGRRPDLPSLEELAEPIDPAQARAQVDAIQAEIDPDELAVFQLSGGTTGTPKLAPRLHAEYWYNARAWADFHDFGDDSRILHMLPIVHNAGVLCALLAAHSCGSALALAGPRPDEYFPLMQEAAVTDTMLFPPSAMRELLRRPDFAKSFATVRRLILAQAKIAPDLFDELEAAGVPVTQIFGMAEGLFMSTPIDGPRQARSTVVGRPMSPLDEVRIYDVGTEQPVPTGEVGELCCRGPYTIRGYFASPEHNRTAFTDDGFYRTGDLAAAHVIDGTTYYSIEGRIKDLINRGGEKVNAGEVELLLGKHPALEAVAVVAMPDERLGERTCAFVVASEGAPELDLADVAVHMASLGAAKFKWPERLVYVDALPLTNVRKVDKKALRTQIAEIVRSERGTEVAHG